MSPNIVATHPDEKIQDIVYASIDSCDRDENPFGDYVASNEHLRVTIDREKFETFIHCCDWIGANPGIEVQQALDLLMDSVIALATATKKD